jgi:hypothetical protein
VADGLDDRHCRVRVADQKKESCRAIVDELVAQRRGGERAHVEFDDSAAAWSEVLPQNVGSRCPVDTRPSCYGYSTVARAEEELCVDQPAVGLRRGEARDPFRRLFGERVENRRRAEERQAEGVGPGSSGASDDTMILPRHGSHAHASQFIYGRRGPLWTSRSVSDHQLEWSSDDSASVIDFANGQFESGEQVLACLDPARSS